MSPLTEEQIAREIVNEELLEEALKAEYFSHSRGETMRAMEMHPVHLRNVVVKYGMVSVDWDDKEKLSFIFLAVRYALAWVIARDKDAGAE